jgi:FAD/FMN-containing dehydrogenase
MADLNARIKGRVIVRGDESYDEVRKVFNGAMDHYPLAIAFCKSTEDVQAAVLVARAQNVPISVRSRGHDIYGRAVQMGAIVIDLSLMNDVTIDGQVAIVAGGASASEVISAASERSLIAVTGWNGVPGMTGLVTGGGYGPLLARYGLALDSLVGVELVLANGERVTADQDTNPDLLWACKGGGGNCGIITSLRLRLHPARPVLAGMILFAWQEAQAVMSRYVKAVENASNDLSVVIGIVSLPDGNPALFLAPVWIGETFEGEAAIEVLKRCGSPIHTQIGTMGYPDLIQSFDARVAVDKHYATETRWLPELSQEAIFALIAGGASRASPFSTIIVQHFRGLPTQLPPDSTAFGIRREHFMIEIIACWDPSDRGDGKAHRRWAHDVSESLRPVSLAGGYPNLLGPHAAYQIKHAYGANLAKLLAVKRQFDPEHVFKATPIPTLPA